VLAVLGVITVVAASTGSATVPSAGINCQTDGKISGRGATFAGKAQTAFIGGFTADVCGNVPAQAGDTFTGNNMVTYNYDPDTGSGAGQKAESCRHDIFGGSDIPYDENTLNNQLNAAPGATGGCVAYGGTQNPATDAPFGPAPGPYPHGGDTAESILSFPIAGSSVAIGVNLQAADCTVDNTGIGIPLGRPTSLNFTAAQVSLIFSGDVTFWDDAALGATAGGANPKLKNCHKAITRVVRLDKSGTTQIFKNFLSNSDGSRHLNDAPCTDTAGLGDVTWTTFAADANNQKWPDDGGSACSLLVHGAANGNVEVVKRCTSSGQGGTGTGGEACYADLSDIAPHRSGTGPIILASIRNSTDTAFVQPVTSNQANCAFGGISLPGTTPQDHVGLNSTDNWGFDNLAVNGNPNHNDLTWTNAGAGYPICGVTFALLYPLQTTPAAFGAGELKADQIRTLYSYELYILSSPGQALLNSIFYASMPSGIITPLRAGFQASF
jgi:ABC-type phosphate transport system substrate-binding protein